MDPITAILAAASIAGAIFGHKKKHIDPEWLKSHFGGKAVSEEAMNLFHSVLNSPAGHSIIANAATQGQNFGRAVNANSAAAGFGGGGGADSGASVFATSAGQGAQDALTRDAQAQMYSNSLPIAQQMVSDRMQAYIQDFQGGGVPTDSANTWSAIGNAAGTAGALKKSAPSPTDTAVNPINIASTPGAPGALSIPVPNPRQGWQGPKVPKFSTLGRFGPQRMVRPLNYNPMGVMN